MVKIMPDLESIESTSFLLPMFFVELIFWLLAGIVGYTYVGYGLLLWILNSLRKPQVVRSTSGPTPRIAHIIAAFNEEEVIRDKILNAAQMDYPAALTRTVVVADGSTDKTVNIIRAFPDIELLFKPERRGKVAALNRAVEAVHDADILIFSDANSFLNPDAFRLIVKHYADPLVGGVAGEKKIVSQDQVSGKGEGMYWKYESLLKKLDSDFYTVVGAAGELFSIRSSMYEPVPEDILLDDLHISLNICKKGKLVKYEPGAYASELPSLSISDEQKRKVRISAGAFQSMMVFSSLLNIFKYGKTSFQYISHRVLRWAVCPFALPMLVLLNIILVVMKQGMIYPFLLGVQGVFYLLALLGWALAKTGLKSRSIFYVPYYFLFMNISVWRGLGRHLAGTQSVTWEKARRGK